MKIWIDIANPSHALFFNSLINDFSSENIFITVRDRAETAELVKSFGIKGKVIGKDYRNGAKKMINVLYRTAILYLSIGKFDYSLSFENGISVTVSTLRTKKSILLCDNDLKFLQRKSYAQTIETKIKSLAKAIIIPKACYRTFKNYIDEKKLVTYDGYKEDVYLANYKPDPGFKDKLPFENFIIIRPEALGSFYVKERRSIVPELLKLFHKENINVVYLPRETEDARYAMGSGVFIPPNALNGMDLCYYANAVLTGSGTMAREAACMGRTAISFFPSDILLSVDQQLIDENKIFHSRNPKEIVEYVLSNYNKEGILDLERSKKVKKEVLKIINACIE